MRFQVGDQVVHPVYGVGTVKACTEQQFAGDETRRYYQVVTSGPTLWVPIDGQGGTVLRGIASRSTLDECRKLLISTPVAFDRNRKVRQMEIAARMKDGSLPSLCTMIRDLTAQRWAKSLGTNEERLLEKATKALSEEWAASAGVSPVNALREIEGLLQKNRGSRTPENLD